MSRRRSATIALVALVIAGLTFNTILVNQQTRPARAEPGGRVLDLPGGAMHVRERGRGDAPVVVLIHGYAISMDWFDPLARELDDEFRVISVDLLGHGGSEKPKDGYSMPEQARLLASALSKLGVEAATVVGHSMGGSVATALAEEASELVDRVVVIGTPPRPKFAKLPLTARLGYVPVLGQLLRRAVPDSMIRSNYEKAVADPDDLPSSAVSDYERMTYTSFARSHDAARDFGEERGLDLRLAAAGLPLLVIFGERDEIVDPDAAEAWRGVPGARISMLPGVGHSPMAEAPRETAALIREFVADPGD